MINAEMIAIGTELLLGQITNTNAQYLSERLAAEGIPVYYHAVVGDNPERLNKQLELSSKRSNLIFFSGGLGPTKDDLTKQTIAAFLNRKIEIDLQAMEQILKFYEQRERTMTENNRRQAEVIEGATVFQNTNGLAPGMALEADGVHYILLPGPPKELVPMVERSVIPYIRRIRSVQKTVFSKILRFCGIGESALEAELQDLIDQQTSPTIAPLAKDGEVTLRLTSFASNQEEAEQEMQGVIDIILERVGTNLYGWDSDSLESVIQQQLKERSMTLAIAESCTGGMLSSFVTRMEGASKVFKGSVVAYTNETKINLLGIEKETLDRYGAVSEAMAKKMAEQARRRFGSAVGLSVTGVAGPSSQEGKPVGLIYVGISLSDQTAVRELRLAGQREAIQLHASKLALFYLIQELKRCTKIT